MLSRAQAYSSPNPPPSSAESSPSPHRSCTQLGRILDDTAAAGQLRNWMVNTPCHFVMDVCAVMRGEVVPDEHPMKISAGNIVRLNICAHVVAKVAEYVGGGANGT